MLLLLLCCLYWPPLLLFYDNMTSLVGPQWSTVKGVSASVSGGLASTVATVSRSKWPCRLSGQRAPWRICQILGRLIRPMCIPRGSYHSHFSRFPQGLFIFGKTPLRWHPPGRQGPPCPLPASVTPQTATGPKQWKAPLRKFKHIGIYIGVHQPGLEYVFRCS